MLTVHSPYCLPHVKFTMNLPFVRLGCSCCLDRLAQGPLVPKNPPPRHGDGNAEPLRNGPVRQPLQAQLVGALVQVDAAVPGHRLMRDQEPYSGVIGGIAARKNEIAQCRP